MSEGHVLITGAAGLIGAAARRLLEAQGRSVVAVDREPSVVEGRPVESCDVTDPHALHAIARRVRLTGVLHCGAFSGPMVAADLTFWPLLRKLQGVREAQSRRQSPQVVLQMLMAQHHIGDQLVVNAVNLPV